MTTYEATVLVHINVAVQVDAENPDAAAEAAEALVKDETLRRGFDAEDVASVEAIRVRS